MTNVVTIDQLVERSKQISSTHPPNHPHLSEFQSRGYAPPKILVVCCADPRCTPEQILGLQPLEAVVFRNPCGHVRPNLEGLLALDCLLGGFSEVMILHHTDCGASMYTDAGTRTSLREATGTKRSLEDLTFGAVEGGDMAQSVRDDMAVFREEPLIRKELKEKVKGFLYDVKTGDLTRID